MPGARALFDALSRQPAEEVDGWGEWPVARFGKPPAALTERETAPQAPARPFFYASSSPWNLHTYLSTFLALNAFPAGVFALRDWGLNRATFGTTSHGAHKGDRIAEILKFHPELSFVLIGDDSQGDVAAYAHAVEAWGERVAGVFIRSTGPNSLSTAEERAVDSIRATGTPVFVGRVWDAGVEMAQRLGLPSLANAVATG